MNLPRTGFRSALRIHRRWLRKTAKWLAEFVPVVGTDTGVAGFDKADRLKTALDLAERLRLKPRSRPLMMDREGLRLKYRTAN